MFTGIIEEKGTITSLEKQQNGAHLTVSCSKTVQDTKIGDSIAVNGVCLTVVEIENDGFRAFASYETLKLTTLGLLKPGEGVNLERALRLSDRMGGHIVSGHVDGIGTFISSTKIGDANKMIFEIPENLMNEVVKKGSIAIDGVSLTVAEVSGNKIATAVIPHTYKNTLLGDLQPNSAVNIETDVIGKYVSKMLVAGRKESKITADFLERNGFI